MATAIKCFDAGARRSFQSAMVKAMDDLAEEYDVEITQAGHIYTDAGQHFEPKFRVTVLDAEGDAFNPSVEEFKRHAEYYGLEVDDLGRTFRSSISGELFKITGCKPSHTKYPIIADRVSDGKGYKFTPREVRRQLEVPA